MTEQISSDVPRGIRILKKRVPLEENKRRFPKRAGIVFLEKISKDRSRIHLNFDQVACAHLVLQMNSVQSIFDFQVIAHDFSSYFVLPTKKEFNDMAKKGDKKLLQWFESEVSAFGQDDTYGIDYWIGITSEKLPDNKFIISNNANKGESGKILWIITSDVWEKSLSPPSLFEFIAFGILRCCLESINIEFKGSLKLHDKYAVRGCILDSTRVKQYRRILISNPMLCSYCRSRLGDLEMAIKNETNTEIPLYLDTLKILSKEWMGSIEKRDSPIYNIKKNYRYDIDTNSGFYKNWLEKIKDNIQDNSIEWLAVGIITMALTLFGNFLQVLLNIPKP